MYTFYKLNLDCTLSGKETLNSLNEVNEIMYKKNYPSIAVFDWNNRCKISTFNGEFYETFFTGNFEDYKQLVYDLQNKKLTLRSFKKMSEAQKKELIKRYVNSMQCKKDFPLSINHPELFTNGIYRNENEYFPYIKKFLDQQ